ncbi:hypothetical protein FDJ70_07420 [Clostridium botulinum]|nr:hypothetical protein [Clostridium botulinum]
MQYIYNKNTLKICGTVCSNMTLEQEIKLNVLPNFAGGIEDYSTIETDIENFHLENQNEKVVVVKDKIELIPKSKPQKSKEELQQEEIENLRQELNECKQSIVELTALASTVAVAKK